MVLTDHRLECRGWTKEDIFTRQVIGCWGMFLTPFNWCWTFSDHFSIDICRHHSQPRPYTPSPFPRGPRPTGGPMSSASAYFDAPNQRQMSRGDYGGGKSLSIIFLYFYLLLSILLCVVDETILQFMWHRINMKRIEEIFDRNEEFGRTCWLWDVECCWDPRRWWGIFFLWQLKPITPEFSVLCVVGPITFQRVHQDRVKSVSLFFFLSSFAPQVPTFNLVLLKLNGWWHIGGSLYLPSTRTLEGKVHPLKAIIIDMCWFSGHLTSLLK